METLRSIIPFAALIASIAVIVLFAPKPKRRDTHVGYLTTTIDGHEYIIFPDQNFVLHNENCPCKQK